MEMGRDGWGEEGRGISGIKTAHEKTSLWTQGRKKGGGWMHWETGGLGIETHYVHNRYHNMNLP